MATTYKSDYVTNGYPVPTPMTGAVVAVTARFTQTAAFVVNDVIKMVDVPNGYQVTDVILDSDDLDTGTAAIVLAVGDAADAAAYITGSTVGQAGGVEHANVAGYMDNTPYAVATSGGNAGSTNIQVKVTTAPATSTTDKTIRLTVYYTQASGVKSASFA